LALCLAHDVACALLHLHSEGIIHGDVKAANVLLACAPGDVAEALPRRAALWRAAAALGGPANQLTAKVADFGLAMVLPAADTHATLVMRVSSVCVW
jgi:serine/threonine protein kinase